MQIEANKEFVFLNQHVGTFYTGISSILGEIKEYVLDQFPQEYFKRVTVETAAPSSLTNQNMQDGLMKMSYPYVNIGVNIPHEYEDKTTRTLLERTELFIKPYIRQNYPRVLIDPDDNFTVGFTYEWVKSSYDFRITTNTFMNSIDVMNWVRTKLPMNFVGYINNVPLEFELPQSIVKTIAELQGYDLMTTEGVKNLDRYLMSVGRMFSLIKRKTSATTGQQSYFMSLNSDIQVLIDNLDAPTSVVRSGQTEGDYVVSFTVTTGTYFPVSYLMKIRKPYLVARVEQREFMDIYNTPNQPLVDGLISIGVDIPLANKRDIINYTTSEGRKSVGHLVDEWRFVYGSEQTEPPVVSIFNLIEDPELKRVHSYALEHGINLENLFHFEGYKVAYSQDDINFIMNYEDFEINIENAEFSEVLIRFYVNRATYDALQFAMQTDTYYFNKNVLCFTDVILWDSKTNTNVTKKIQVNFFKDSVEMYDENPLKSLKIMTKYGYGYLNIRPYMEDPNRVDDIMLVVLGYETKLVDGEPVPILYEIIFS